MNINNRVKEIRIHFCNDNNILFAETLGVSQQYASNITREGKSVGKSAIKKITSSFPSVNINWLLTGEGKMLKKDEDAYINSIAPDPPEHIQYFFDKIDERDKEIKRLNETLIEKERENGNLRALVSKLETMLQSNGIDSKQTGS